MNFIVWLSNYIRQRQAQSLINRIAALHPELDRFEGEAKIEYYMKSCYRYFFHQRKPETRSKLDFNEEGSSKDPALRGEALDYLSTRSARAYHFDLLQAQMQIQSLGAQLDQLRVDALLKDQQLDQAQQLVKATQETFNQVQIALQPNSRLN